MPAFSSAGFCAKLESIVSIGNRFGGSPGEKEACDAIYVSFKEFGLENVRLEVFDYLRYRAIGAECRIVGERLELPCAPLQTTCDGEAEGPAMYVGEGNPDDLAFLESRGAQFAGCVAILQGGFPFLSAPILAERGVAAIVNVSDAPEGVIGNFTARLYPPPSAPPWEGRVLPIPGVTVEASAARRLLSTMSTGSVVLHVAHRAEYEASQAANVRAEILGCEPDEASILVGAHYDSQLEGPGAWDNATGVAALLELGERWQAIRPRRTIELVGFALEEYALWGSYMVALQARGERRMAAMVNLDALGSPFPATRLLMADNAIASFADQSARRTGWVPDLTAEASEYPIADYSPFIDQAIPACGLWQISPQHPYYHTSRDLLEYVDIRRALEAATASAYIAFRAAHMPKLPFGSASPERKWLSEGLT
jgi:hypothetical protein